MNLDELRQRLADLNAEALNITALAEGEKRDLSVEETERLDAVLSAFDRCKTDIDRGEKLQSQTALLTKPAGRKTQPSDPQNLNAEDEPAPRQLGRRGGFSTPGLDLIAKGNGGFRSLGDFAHSVMIASKNGGTMDGRLEKLGTATTYGNESSASDGGFAIPPDFRTAIMTTIMAEDSLLSRCDQITVNGNNFTCPIDETTPWQTTGGILANWEGEASTATQSKPALGEVTVKLHKLRCLVPVTEEILEDASAMDSYLRRKAPDKIAFKINDALVNGTGTGMPLGIIGAPAAVTVTKEGSQTNTTFIAKNAMKMYNRLYGPCRTNAVWLYNQDVEPELFKLSIAGTDNVGNAVTGWGGIVWMPAGGLSGSPYSTLYGRPMIPTQACQTLGTAGDVILADFTQYLAILKGGPNPRVDVSMHLWFDQDITAFKFVLRMGGLPWWSTTAAAKNGSNTYSPFVVMGGRP